MSEINTKITSSTKISGILKIVIFNIKKINGSICATYLFIKLNFSALCLCIQDCTLKEILR